MTAAQIRPVLFALLAALSALGWLSEDVRAVIQSNADAILTGVFAVVAVVEHLLGRAKPAPPAGPQVVPAAGTRPEPPKAA